MKATVLRLGHRKERDKRITTHVALVSRAFFADSFVLSGEEDESVLKSIEGVVKNWGGRFSARYEKGWKGFVKRFKRKGIVVHLTFYGAPLGKKIGEIRKQARKKELLVMVGAEKVPREAYELADYNVSVTNQPHSEVAALAVFLHELMGGKELKEAEERKKFRNSRIRIIPMEKGKKVLRSK